MGKFSNRVQVVYAATCWVFGGDDTLTNQEQFKMKEAINRSKTPWTLDEEDAHWVVSLWKGNNIQLDDVVDAVNYDFEFSLEDNYILYSCGCLPMNKLGQGDNYEDGWSRGGELRDALGIALDNYNRCAKR